MTYTEALDLAIAALEEQAEPFKLDQRAVDILGPTAGPAAHKNIKKRRELLEAISMLKLHKKEATQ